MGYREWRERQLARADALTARADRMDAARDEAKVAREAEAERVRVEREAAKIDGDLAWFESRARALGESHADLAARASLVGVGLPRPRRVHRGRVLAAVGELAVMDGSGVHGESHDPYRVWRDRIVVEERCALKVARGEGLSVLDRASLKAARLASR